MGLFVSLLFVTVFVLPSAIERFAVRRWRFAFGRIAPKSGASLPLEVPPDVARGLLRTEGGSYREAPLPALDAHAVDGAAVERLFTVEGQVARYSAEEGVLVIMPRRTWGKSRSLWVWRGALRLDGDRLVLEPRVWFGGLVPTIVQVAFLAWLAPSLGAVYAIGGGLFFLLKVLYLRSQLAAVGADVASRLGALLAAPPADVPTRVAAETTETAMTADPTAPEDEEPAAASEGGARRGLS